MNKVKIWWLNVVSLVLCVGMPTFSIVASWAILHRTAEIVMQMQGRLDLVVTTTIFIGAILVWLNSMVIDSSVWVATHIEKTKKDLN